MVHIPKIDLNLFVVFDAIYREGGVTRASERLHLTQPAISHALSRLRTLFDDPLFVRQGHAMIPTPVARSIVEPVRRALRTLEATVTETSRFDPAEAHKQMALGVHESLEATVLPGLMGRLVARAPFIDVTAMPIERRQLEARLADGTLDLALDVVLPLSGDVLHRRVAEDRLVVVARRDHPAIGIALDLATYLDQSHVLVTSRRRGAGAIDAELARRGLKRRIRLRGQYYFAACRVVSETDLLLTMPEYDARLCSRQFDNRILPLPIDMAPIDVHLYWHVSTDKDPANQWMRDEIGRAFDAASFAPDE
ncbi:MAG TPA: LysR family transcriptional regulator [Aliidongia sp.]|uniref:LysR family transcriptional regulator n=1 Tax=Aliidongia sp. TaxID=1914230 RepID=UPI002DDD2BFB|nr:LysR family transcriptional regulator [Aliidongia sp.]HEV2673099.1 LysR family transcriptional regulator [Aliidongia sp.]